MPNLGVPELLIIMVIILLVFGVGRLPEVGGALGKGIREFRKASRGEDGPEALAGPDRTASADAEDLKRVVHRH